MARDLDPAVGAEVVKDLLRPILLFEGDFVSGMLRLWSGIGPFDWNGFTWQGVGNLGGVGPIQEADSVVATGFTVSLSGIDEGLIEIAYNEVRQGAPCSIYLAFLDAADDLIGEPYLMAGGRLDVVDDEDDADKSKILITYESEMIDLERAREWRFTDEDQKIDNPDDEFFKFKAALQDKTILWGRT